MTRFRVLGPLLVEGQASPALRAQMVRRLLAALLCRPNAVVPVDDLTTALWGGQAPPTARKTLQVYVRRLRTALGDAKRIISEPGGYRIAIAPHDLDSVEFAELVNQGKLRDALELWRGAAFEDVRENPPISDEAHRLDEERMRVEAKNARQELQSGRHAELIPHLRRLIEIHPYHEEFRAHLMLALYKSGRQTESLELYRSTRRLLDEELGVEPGADLQRLHEAILRGDASLTASPPTTVPRELPADITSFVGRHRHLRILDAMLGDPSPVVISAIAGSAGVGKTALAVHWAHRVADLFPDGQLHVNLLGFDPTGDPVPSADVLRRFLEALGVAPHRIPVSLDAKIAMYRSQLAHKRMLVVLDNARNAEQVRPLLPGSPTCLVVVTSRDKLASLVATNGARPLMLDVLTIDEARQLLAARLGHNRVMKEPEAVDEIIDRCVRLPLALAIAAAQAVMHAEMPLKDLASELINARNQLDAFNSDDDPVTDLRAVFSWSYRQLSSEAAELFSLLGLHPGPEIGGTAAASLTGLTPARVQPLLAELTQAHLITEHVPGRFTIHDLLRVYAAELAQVDIRHSQRHAAINRAFDYYVHTAYKADRLLEPSRDPITLSPAEGSVIPEKLADFGEAMAWFAVEDQVLQAMIHQRRDIPYDRHVCQLAFSLRSFLDRQGRWDAWAAVQLAAYKAAERLSDLGMQAIACNGVALAYTRLGRYNEAKMYRRLSLDLYREQGDQRGQAYAHMGLGWVLGLQDRHADALCHARLALKFFREASHQIGQANALNMIGSCHSQLGEHHEALNHCLEALGQLQQLGDRLGEADAWDSIGLVQHKQCRYSDADVSFVNAIQIYREYGHRSYEAETLSRLGDNKHASGDHEAARDAWQQALEILAELDHHEADLVRSKLESSNLQALRPEST